jgi:hypothetical protein
VHGPLRGGNWTSGTRIAPQGMYEGTNASK